MRVPLSRLLGLLAALPAVASLGCGQCTLKGCTDALTIEVVSPEGQPVSAFQGEARFGERTVAIRCGDEASGDGDFWCRPDGVVLQAIPESVELTLEDSANPQARFGGTLSPAYETYYPNGEACDAEWGGCRQARVRAVLTP